MEFEILNEIMTSTVAQLFTINRQSHLKFFKNSSQLNESKIDIPLNRAGSSTNLGGEALGPQNNSAADNWVATHGKKFLEESRERLMIGNDPKQWMYRGQPLQALNVDELSRIKRSVKSELKRYDQAFVQVLFRQPGKQEKEPLRPLYMYYKKLKTLISSGPQLVNNGQPSSSG
jgi:Asp-tRNA(Asn)/Glu-tRNA(Gln) amidotransferase A subunit family amidase